MYVIKAISSLIGIAAFTIMMYLAIQSVLVPLNHHLDALEQITAIQEQYHR